MSRIGRKPINVPASVTVTAEGSQVVAKGPKGELALATRPEVDVVIDGNVVTVENKGGARDRQARSDPRSAAVQGDGRRRASCRTGTRSVISWPRRRDAGVSLRHRPYARTR